MRLTTGTYTGNGLDNRGITGVGFQPELVIIHDTNTADSYVGVWKTASMAGDSAFFFQNSPLGANNIQSLDADGFQVGSSTSVNKDTLLYAYAAFKKDAATDFNYGSFAGNDADDRWITGVGFQPDFIFIKSDADGIMNNHWISSLGGDQTLNTQSCTGGPIFNNIIQAVNGDGFQVGNRDDTYQSSNKTGQTYYWFAFKQVAGGIKVGNYTGNDADDRSITGVGFQPTFVLLSNITTVARQNAIRYGTVGDLSGYCGGGWTADLIQALETDGFQVGSYFNVNKVAEVYHYFACKDNPYVARGTTGLQSKYW